MKYYEFPIAYGAIINDEYIRSNSRSGGLFTAISDYVLQRGGSVYGAILDENLLVKHIRTIDYKTRDKCRESKYIQSSMNDCYRNVREDLSAGLDVLFSGTSCQVKGILNYLGEDYDKLITTDILCHGVASPKIWKDYLKWQEDNNDGNIIDAKFRNKKDYGWSEHVESMCFKDGRQINSKIFAELYYKHNALRPCCYECKYKRYVHPGDITLGDFWEIKNIDPDYDDNKGLSLVLINNDKGKRVFETIKGNLIYKEFDYKKTFRKSMLVPYPEPVGRDDFWRNYQKNGFEYVVSLLKNGKNF